MSYKVISFDIFQTLADVNRRIPEIWRGILKDEYTDEKAERGAKAILSRYPGIYQRAVASETFSTMEEVYTECSHEALCGLGFNVSAEEVAYHLMFQHSKAPLYDEVPACIDLLRTGHQIILSSDSSHLMVDDLIRPIHYDRAFISDDLKCYKGDLGGRFFSAVLAGLDARPEEIIHVGDSAGDVLGASRAGITSCWLNRGGREWEGPVRPDYIIRDLTELADIVAENTAPAEAAV